MPDLEDELPDFDELDLSAGEAAAEPEPTAEAAPSEGPEPAAQPAKEGAEDEGEQKELVLEAEEEELEEEKAEPEEEEKEEEGEEKGGFLEALSAANPHTVLLGVALLAILIAVFCLFMELRRYEYDIKAEKAKQRSATAPGSRFAPAGTMFAGRPVDPRSGSGPVGAAEESGWLGII